MRLLPLTALFTSTTMTSMNRGAFIVFEGGDRCGKVSIFLVIIFIQFTSFSY